MSSKKSSVSDTSDKSSDSTAGKSSSAPSRKSSSSSSSSSDKSAVPASNFSDSYLEFIANTSSNFTSTVGSKQKTKSSGGTKRFSSGSKVKSSGSVRSNCKSSGTIRSNSKTSSTVRSSSKSSGPVRSSSKSSRKSAKKEKAASEKPGPLVITQEEQEKIQALIQQMQASHAAKIKAVLASHQSGPNVDDDDQLKALYAAFSDLVSVTLDIQKGYDLLNKQLAYLHQKSSSSTTKSSSDVDISRFVDPGTRTVAFEDLFSAISQISDQMAEFRQCFDAKQNIIASQYELYPITTGLYSKWMKEIDDLLPLVKKLHSLIATRR